ncbi:hypothetical protein [Sinorhizobium fredii]|nr:hypothetical protein [Sinorhizobium fredii]ASY67451.1 hypothetical protein SF83666_c00020 [Sinorhizobium fredii CCBAU 83666]AWM23288.1 hypothetical protein AOX55_00002 [Sinorhizobium fredii CCBAU 25509]KSV87791.1 hypothetical protein N181_17515 [Sinorhizobium fredii USDA 205]AWI55689.1 hypothetical protein AB395_00002 [Sinorhizobium fredii CCBAU 45436]WOS63114.1 hypothetical protein SFGR64A_01595 [Sinorhizobium fredii GR64]
MTKEITDKRDDKKCSSALRTKKSRDGAAAVRKLMAATSCVS